MQILNDAHAPPDGRARLLNAQGLDGGTHFRMRRLRNVATQMSLQVLAYNLKRVMAILGTGPLLTALRA